MIGNYIKSNLRFSLIFFFILFIATPLALVISKMLEKFYSRSFRLIKTSFGYDFYDLLPFQVCCEKLTFEEFEA
jgi:uncharacterized membrane protein